MNLNLYESNVMGMRPTTLDSCSSALHHHALDGETFYLRKRLAFDSPRTDYHKLHDVCTPLSNSYALLIFGQNIP